MSPTIARSKNLRYVIRTDDHGNPHVHVVGPDAEAKIYLNTFWVERNHGFTERALAKIIDFIKLNNDKYLEYWYEIHEKHKEEK